MPACLPACLPPCMPACLPVGLFIRLPTTPALPDPLACAPPPPSGRPRGKVNVILLSLILLRLKFLPRVEFSIEDPCI